MNKILTLVIILVARTIAVNGQCTSNYSYSGTTDTLTFTNQSTVSNAHFYWNFGDGSGSNDFSPSHVFPDDGKYLVTLYGVDTLTNCVDVKQNWIDVTKPDTFPCYILFTDTIIGGYLQTTNLSSNCSGYNVNCHVAGPAQYYCGSIGLDGWSPALFMHGMQAISNDSIYGYRIFNGYYKTLPWNYSSSNNYQDCSANFEVIIDYQPDFAVATFTAMNKNASGYTFYITGFGNPIPLSGQSVSFNFNYNYGKFFPINVYLITSDIINNCSDTVVQQILIRNPDYTFPVSCAIYSPIQSQTAVAGTNIQFYISASSNANYQWQQDAGLGYVNLTNAGPYSGVTTNTLTISNVQTTMNNNQFRCIIYDSLGGCHNTSLPASLSVPVGINDIELMNIKFYPNPASSYLTIDLPPNINNASVTFYSVLGQEQFNAKTDKSLSNIDIQNLTKGVYFVELISDSYVGRFRFIKQQ